MSNEGQAIVVTIDNEETNIVKRLCHQKVVEKLKNMDAIVVIGGDTDASVTYAEHLVHLLRKYNLHDNDRQTVFSQEDSLNMLQLCLAQNNQKKFGSFEVEASSVLSATQHLTDQKLGATEAVLDDDLQDVLNDYKANLECGNTLDLIDVLNKIKEEKERNEALQKEIASTSYIIYEAPVSRIEREIMTVILEKFSVQVAMAEVPLSGQGETDSPTVLYETVDDLEEAMSRLSHSSHKPRTSVTESYAEKVIMSYLELLVNSRNEIALARIIDIPNRGLDHKAFTDLKHVAKPKNMSMYQTAVSHVMRIRLGGKSYAPSSDNPLTQHTKGLSELVDLIHKLQSIVEEEVDTSKALRRVLNVIKNAIVNHKENTLRKQSIEAVNEKLQAKAEQVFTFVKTNTEQSPPKSVGKGGSMLGRMTLKVIRYLLDSFISQSPDGNMVDYLSDRFSSQKTPVRFPCLLSQFRSPIEASPECVSNKSLAERVSNRLKPINKMKSVVPRFQSCMDWAMPVHDSGFHKENNLVIDDFIPSKTIVHPAENTFMPKVTKRTAPESRMDQENVDILISLSESNSEETKHSNTRTVEAKPSKSLKRPLQSSQNTDSQSKKPRKSNPPKPSKKKGPTLSKGQTQLTAFFRI